MSERERERGGGCAFAASSLINLDNILFYESFHFPNIVQLSSTSSRVSPPPFPLLVNNKEVSAKAIDRFLKICQPARQMKCGFASSHINIIMISGSLSPAATPQPGMHDLMKKESLGITFD